MRLLLVILCLSVAEAQFSTKLDPETVAAFDQYVNSAEPGLARPTFRVDGSSEARKQVLKGQVAIESLLGTRGKSVPGGLLHDWVGTVFIPNRTPSEVIEQLRDYEHHSSLFPEVVRGRILSANGNNLKVYLRIRKKNVLTVNLNTEYDVQLKQMGEDRMLWSHSTKVTEIDNADGPNERELPLGQDHGFLWRINAYWLARAVDGGSLVECRSVSLSRDVPFGLGTIVRPFIKDLPRQSLDTLLTALKQKLSKS